MSRLHPLVRILIPRSVRDWLRGIAYPDTASSWIYDASILNWLTQPRWRAQLPPLHRFFGWFCAQQIARGATRLAGAESLFGILLRVDQRLTRQRDLELQLDGRRVFLRRHDPRLLLVPGELLSPSDEARALLSMLAVGDTFVDAGANHGSFSLLAAGVVGKSGLVAAIEPQPALAQLVEKSLAANGHDRFQVHAIACGEQPGELDFFVPRGSSGSAGVFAKYSAQEACDRLTVPVRRFDDAVPWREFPGRVFMKIDVEGSELYLLRGAAEFLRSRRPVLLLEINLNSMQAAGVAATAIPESLAAQGYTTYAEVHDPPQRHPLAEFQPRPQRNVLFFTEAVD